MSDHAKQFAFIAACQEPKRLRDLMRKAQELGATDVADAAFKKLISIVPGESPGTVEHDFWQTILAFESVLTEEKGKTIRLARTRQKVNRVGVIRTLEDWALASGNTDGFTMLLERGMPALTGEAIVLRHPDRFQAPVRDAARRRLLNAGVDPNGL